jgi:hypothetical protein
LIAEEECKKTVDIVATQNEIEDAKEWAEKTINSSYLVKNLS